MKRSTVRQIYSDVEKRTKEIYISQHRNYSIDKAIFNRFLGVASDPMTYDVSNDFFAGKSVLDAGCGNTGYFQVAMKSLGASKVTCLDLGTSWMDELKQVMQEHCVPDHYVEYVEGSTTSLPFEDESFDFVASNGVIMHLESQEDAAIALSELGRVAKRGGSVYVYTGIEQPGIIDKYIVPALRKAYEEDAEFRGFIDHIDNKKVAEELKTIFSAARNFDESIPQSLIESIDNLFTLDSATFAQNMLQVPCQQGSKLGFDWAKCQLERLGLSNIRRVKERYWMRNDYRKFLAPLHYHREVGIARLLYGGGHVKVIADKPL